MHRGKKLVCFQFIKKTDSFSHGMWTHSWGLVGCFLAATLHAVCFLVFGLGDQILKLKFGSSPIILWRSIFVWRQHHYWFSWEYWCFIIGWWFEIYVMLVCDLRGRVYILLLINSYCWYDRFCQVLIGALSNSLAMMNMHICLKEHYYGGWQVFWVSWSLATGWMT